MFVALSLYHMFAFANQGLTPETKLNTGYSYLSVVFICLGLNVLQALFFAIKRVYLKLKNRLIKPKLKAEIELGDQNADTVVNYKRKYETQFGKIEGDSSCYNDESKSDISEYEVYKNIQGLVGNELPVINDDGLFVEANAAINIGGQPGGQRPESSQFSQMRSDLPAQTIGIQQIDPAAHAHFDITDIKDLTNQAAGHLQDVNPEEGLSGVGI